MFHERLGYKGGRLGPLNLSSTRLCCSSFVSTTTLLPSRWRGGASCHAGRSPVQYAGERAVCGLTRRTATSRRPLGRYFLGDAGVSGSYINGSLSPYLLVAWGPISPSQLMCTSDPIWRKRLAHGSSVHILSGSWWYTRRGSHSTCPVSGHPPVRTTILNSKGLQFGENGTTYRKQAFRMASDIPKASGMMKSRWRL